MKRLKQILTPTRILLTYSVLASTAALVLFFLFLNGYQLQQRMSAEQSFQRLTRDSVLSVTRPLTVSPAEHRAYMPEAGLSLPQDDMTPKLLYSYDPQTLANGQSAAYLTFYSRPAVYDISSRDFDDPLCRSVAQLTIDDKYYDKGLSPAATIHLDDGRIAYVYSSQSDACDRAGNVRGGVSPDKTVRLLKQVKSY